jgi:G3E family GTPase
MSATKLVLVGGFLGAGKTTLLAQAGRRLARQGKTVGFITNDQADQLVDTALLKQAGMDVKEVAGACFCCKFDELIERGEELLKERKPDLLISEPVGSCTDLSATVLQPIKKFFAGRFSAAPFSVVVDPLRLRQALSDTPSVFTGSVLYIFAKQLEEADIIVLNKTDQLPAAERAELLAVLQSRYPHAQAVALSALNGDGVDEWLELIQKNTPAGARIAQVDYDTYADGEAVLGWLNASANLSAPAGCDWRAFAYDLLRAFKKSFAGQGAEVAHVKLFLTAPGTGLVANLTSSKGMPFVLVEGTRGEPTASARLIVNARVHIAPAALKAAVEQALAGFAADGVTADILKLDCFAPGRPRPTHRFSGVVTA